jgi:hypothetical protein
MSKGSSDLGIDFERDIDRIAVATDGIAMSGFFEGKPIVQTIVAHEGGYEERQYRGNTIWMSQSGGFAQIGNLVLWGPPESMERLVDRAIDPAPEGADPEDIYGDIFVRTDLAGRSARANATMLDAVLAGLNGVTVRANVWDMVALSVEGTPQAGRSVTDLAALARAALSVARQQLDPNDVELATLADLAKVSSSDGALKLDLALPMNDVFDKLHFPCPGAKKVEQAGGASP